jgi:hypothetical protein
MMISLELGGKEQIPMKKLWIFLVIFCMMAGSLRISAENYWLEDSISSGDTRVIAIPQPEGEIDPGMVYFTQEFTFVPEQDGTYRFLVSYEEDESEPYNIFMDVAGPYQQLKNGCEFEAVAGETYVLCFQYPTHDGRYPEFTFWVDTADGTYVPETEPVAGTEAPETVPETIPETEPTAEETPVGIDGKTILCCIGAVLLVGAAIALMILERKKNTSSDSL